MQRVNGVNGVNELNKMWRSRRITPIQENTGRMDSINSNTSTEAICGEMGVSPISPESPDSPEFMPRIFTIGNIEPVMMQPITIEAHVNVNNRNGVERELDRFMPLVRFLSFIEKIRACLGCL